MLYKLICEWCGEEFRAEKLKGKGGKPRRFCNTKCSARWRMSRPEYVKTLDTPKRRRVASERMKRVNQEPWFRAKVDAYLHSDRNPFRNPQIASAIRRKAQIVLRERGYDFLNGGNGRPLPVPQRLLAARLGWSTEFIVRTLTKKSEGFPTHYKIDIAEPLLKIAIEIDGHGHLAKRIQEADHRKTAFLESRGWIVLRFWNHQVMANLEEVTREILITVRSKSIT